MEGGELLKALLPPNDLLTPGLLLYGCKRADKQRYQDAAKIRFGPAAGKNSPTTAATRLKPLIIYLKGLRRGCQVYFQACPR